MGLLPAPEGFPMRPATRQGSNMMRRSCVQRSIWLPGRKRHQGGEVTVHCKACSLQPFGRLAGSLTAQLSGEKAAPHPEQFGVCMVACLLGPLQPCNVLPGVCRSRVQYLCQDDLPELSIFPAVSAQLGRSQMCLWTPPGEMSQVGTPLADRTKPASLSTGPQSC